MNPAVTNQETKQVAANKPSRSHYHSSDSSKKPNKTQLAISQNEIDIPAIPTAVAQMFADMQQQINETTMEIGELRRENMELELALQTRSDIEGQMNLENIEGWKDIESESYHCLIQLIRLSIPKASVKFQTQAIIETRPQNDSKGMAGHQDQQGPMPSIKSPAREYQGDGSSTEDEKKGLRGKTYKHRWKDGGYVSATKNASIISSKIDITELREAFGNVIQPWQPPTAWQPRDSGPTATDPT